MTEQSFNLVTEPWIEVLDAQGVASTVSLSELFKDLEHIALVSGDMPTQDFAIFRLLLAIAHRAVEGPVDQNNWFELWEDPQGFSQACQDYLSTWQHRFDLFDPQQPFYQVANLAPCNPKETGSLRKLIASVPDNFPLFTSHLGSGLDSLSGAEAARWLIHLQAYDTSGIKTGMVGDDRVKGGKGYPIGTGWAGNLGGLVIEGSNLFQTLLLNLVPMPTTSSAYDCQTDLPVWERAPQSAIPDGVAPGVDARPPLGKVDLYTWQVRRVRLVPDSQGNVISAIVGNGDKISGHNKHVYEPLTGWRFSEPQTKAYKTDVYMPRTHDPSRRLWRGLQSVVSNTFISEGKSRGFQSGNLAFLHEIQEFVGLTGLLRVRAYGIAYGPQSAVFEECFYDSITAPVSVYTSPDLGNLALDAASAAEKAVYVLADFAQNLAYAAGADRNPPDRFSEGPRSRAQSEAFGVLEGLYRQWLHDLIPESSSTAMAEWRTVVRNTVQTLADQYALEAGPASLIGREIELKSKEVVHLNTARAQLFFYGGLNKALPKEQE